MEDAADSIVPAELTVVIPTSGRWAVLNRTLDALAAQTVRGFATIVVVDGLDAAVPGTVHARAGVRVLAQQAQGPGVARNLGVAVSETSLILFLGDDTIPEPELVERHLRRHAAEPDAEVAVLGAVRWHPQVAGQRVNRFLDWSAMQFDYAALDAEHAGVGPGAVGCGHDSPGRGRGQERLDAGFARFYGANVSLKRALFEDFDPAFTFAYEDMDLGWRLAQRGMILRYEPEALARHLHAYTVAGLRRRFELIGEGERRMVAKHDWFEPFFQRRFRSTDAGAPVSGIWARVHDRVPRSWERIWWPVHARAERWYQQLLGESFAIGWDRALDLEELRAYLGPRFDLEALQGHARLVEEEIDRVGDEARFYRSSEAYLYDLTVFAMGGTKLPYHATLRKLVPTGSRVLDYGAGIGADGLRLAERGYRVSFADFDNPSLAFLRWRLARRGLVAGVHTLDDPATLGRDFDLAYAFDVIEHVPDPWAFLAELESRARLVVVNLLEPDAEDPVIHHELPIRAILAHARSRGLVRHERHHGRSHLIAYRGGGAPAPRQSASAPRSARPQPSARTA